MTQNKLNYCPNCGKKEIVFREVKYWSCTECGFRLFHNVAGATALLIFHSNELLLIKRNQEPAKGLWDLPGGFIDPNETTEEAVVREVEEELYLKIKPSEVLYLGSEPNVYLYEKMAYRTIDLFFSIEIQKMPKSWNKEEIQEWQWVSKEKFSLESLAFDSMKRFFSKHKKRLPW